MKKTEEVRLKKLEATMNNYFLDCMFFLTKGLCDFSPWFTFMVKASLMPLLMIWVWYRLGSMAPKSLVLGLIFATLGDVFLELAEIFVSEDTFKIGIASFLIMQLCYIWGIKEMATIDKGIPYYSMAFYTIMYACVNLILGPRAKNLQLPILVYSATLVMTAAVSSGFSDQLALGGLIFAASDFLILLGLVDMNFPYRVPLVGLTYVVAQYLIVTGWCDCFERQIKVLKIEK